MHMNKHSVQHVQQKQCARSRFVQHQTKQLCSLLLMFADVQSQRVSSPVSVKVPIIGLKSLVLAPKSKHSFVISSLQSLYVHGMMKQFIIIRVVKH